MNCGVGFRCSLDLVFLWLWLGWQFISDSAPSLGTSICCECSPKKQKKQQKTNKQTKKTYWGRDTVMHTCAHTHTHTHTHTRREEYYVKTGKKRGWSDASTIQGMLGIVNHHQKLGEKLQQSLTPRGN